MIRAGVLPAWYALAFFGPIPLLAVAGDYAVIAFGLSWLVLGLLLIAPGQGSRRTRPE